MKKIFAIVLVFCLTLCMFAGCGKEENTGTDSGSVYWLNFKPEADGALQEIAKTYTQKTGVKVTVETAASGNYESTLTAKMDTSKAPTLFVVGNAAAVKTWKDYCYDLKDTAVYKELTTDDFTLYDDSGKVCSIGYCYECFGIIVNTKLLEKAGHSVDEIKNFETLKAVADDIHARSKELGFDAFTSSGMDDSSSWRFSGHLANMPLFYEARDNNWKECPPTIKGTYLDNFKNIWDLYITDSAVSKETLATGGYDAEAEFKKGEAVFFQNGSWEYANLVDTIGADSLQMIPIYCGVEGEEKAGLCSGTENCWAVNSKASEADRKATLDFMYWMVTSSEGTKCMAEQFGEIPYKGAAKNENVFFKNANDLREKGNYTVDWTFNYTPNVNEWRATVVAAMNAYDSGKGSWDDVKTAFVEGWAQQYNAANAE